MVQRDEDGLSVPRLFLPRLSVHPRRGQFRQRETNGRTARRDPKDHRLPTSLRQGRRAVGMRVERDETRSARKTVSGRCISPTSTRSVDDDVATDPERRARWNRVRHDRVINSLHSDWLKFEMERSDWSCAYCSQGAPREIPYYRSNAICIN